MANRQVVLDTETTGLEWRLGDRVIEIGCVELVDRKLTGRRFHRYLNPERDIDPGAQAVHGLTAEFLADKPRFVEVADALLDFVQGAELVIHNAAFDMGFLNNELGLIERPALDSVCSGVLDSWRLAREMRPGKKNNLDALCAEYRVDNSGRELHGALLDAELLAEVYLAMTRCQESLVMDLASPPPTDSRPRGPRRALSVVRASADELAQHATLLDEVDKESKGACLWLADAGRGG